MVPTPAPARRPSREVRHERMPLPCRVAARESSRGVGRAAGGRLRLRRRRSVGGRCSRQPWYRRRAPHPAARPAGTGSCHGEGADLQRARRAVAAVGGKRPGHAPSARRNCGHARQHRRAGAAGDAWCRRPARGGGKSLGSGASGGREEGAGGGAADRPAVGRGAPAAVAAAENRRHRGAGPSVDPRADDRDAVFGTSAPAAGGAAGGGHAHHPGAAAHGEVAVHRARGHAPGRAHVGRCSGRRRGRRAA